MNTKGSGPNYNADGTHQESLETLKFISNWCDIPFPFSRNEQWDRFGILGVLSHMILLGLPDANILEIGVGESSIYLTETARRLKRRIFYCDFALGKIFNPMTINGYLHEDTYLITNQSEISEYFDWNAHKAFAFAGTSDDFFKKCKFPKVGLVFIDGDHDYEYVKKDFDNAFDLLCDNGYIFLHDTMPPDESYVINKYCSDAYKIRKYLSERQDLEFITFVKNVAMGVGLTAVRKKAKNLPYYQE